MTGTHRKADLILHPVRMRILLCMAGNKAMTAQQIQEQLPDVPQATLYRHIKTLSESGMLTIADEKQNRGTVERWYRLAAEDSASITPEDAGRLTKEEHMEVFVKFASLLIAQYGKYLERAEADPAADKVSFRQIALHLSEEEHMRLLGKIRELFAEAARNGPAPERRSYVYTLAAVPE